MIERKEKEEGRKEGMGGGGQASQCGKMLIMCMFKQTSSYPCTAWVQMETPIPCAQIFKVIRQTHK